MEFRWYNLGMERCELLIKAKGLAIKKGLDPEQVNCPVEKSICDGSFCIFMASDGVNHGEVQISKFYKRIERHKAIITAPR